MAAQTEWLEPGLRRVIAPNPSPMTYRGTNTYILGDGAVAVIDPGPEIAAHFDALMATLRPGERVTHILVTHSHLDHSPLARRLARMTGAPVLAFGTHLEGRSNAMRRLAETGMVGGGEGIDPDFRPDTRLADGDRVLGEGWEIAAIHTPGHIANHLSFAWQDAVFTGDHVMGWASSLVSPPDGDLGAFMASCRKLQGRGDRVFYPGHGDPVENTEERLAWLLDHRLARETQILEALAAAPADPATLARIIYTDSPLALLPAAERNVLAHLIDLSQRGLVASMEPLGRSAIFHLADNASKLGQKVQNPSGRP